MQRSIITKIKRCKWRENARSKSLKLKVIDFLLFSLSSKKMNPSLDTKKFP